ncbi:hypothetical protein [Bordetella genomosp. 9]|uniref:EscI/YscI/HrpB family type III secretion system inner rod protein n=1 Tax=Bordetella genomosp. 9 TaxID=1416803 RepID=A0A1W6YXG0_9BORD|nr:hypothetical protein [Bordetella genomosp. 9]ARP85654.1 hypothetical protein CAL13_05095 [Bordetella genomosp. 9]
MLSAIDGSLLAGRKGDTPVRPDPASSEATKQFNAIMNGSSGQPDGGGNAISVQSQLLAHALSAAPSSQANSRSIGDRILEVFRHGAVAITHDWSEVQNGLQRVGNNVSSSSGGQTLHDLVTLQMRFVIAATKTDMMTKAIGKTLYTVDSISRM